MTRSCTRRAVAGWMAIALLHDGGFADYVADAAFLGINLARWLAGN